MACKKIEKMEEKQRGWIISRSLAEFRFAVEITQYAEGAYSEDPSELLSIEDDNELYKFIQGNEYWLREWSFMLLALIHQLIDGELTAQDFTPLEFRVE